MERKQTIQVFREFSTDTPKIVLEKLIGEAFVKWIVKKFK